MPSIDYKSMHQNKRETWTNDEKKVKKTVATAKVMMVTTTATTTTTTTSWKWKIMMRNIWNWYHTENCKHIKQTHFDTVSVCEMRLLFALARVCVWFVYLIWTLYEENLSFYPMQWRMVLFLFLIPTPSLLTTAPTLSRRNRIQNKVDISLNYKAIWFILRCPPKDLGLCARRYRYDLFLFHRSNSTSLKYYKSECWIWNQILATYFRLPFDFFSSSFCFRLVILRYDKISRFIYIFSVACTIMCIA